MTRIALLLLLALAGCGNKGPLLMPDPATDSGAQPAAAPVEQPAVSEPAAPAPEPADPAPSASGTPAS